MRNTVISLALGLLLASVVSGLVGSAVQTHMNLAALESASPGSLSSALTPAVRRAMYFHDIVNFAPLFAALSALSFIPAFAVAGLLARSTSRSRTLRAIWYTLAGFAGLLVALLTMNWLMPMPAFIVVTHHWTGLLAMSASGLVGGWVFASWVRPKRTTGAFDHVEFH